MLNTEQIVEQIYMCFNARDIDGVLLHLAADVAWANGMEGTHVLGVDAVRAYWTHQWAVIDPHVEPQSVREAEDGTTVVSVHLVVHDLEGKKVLDERLEHVFRIENGRVARFDIRGDSQLSAIPH